MIRVYNTLTRKKEDLVPLVAGKVGMYVCGPTVYGYIHIGNARTFTSFDLIARYLRYRGLELTYVRNFTDVDDKIIKAAKESGEDPIALAARFADAFRDDARALKLIEPDAAPKVSEHIPEILALVQTLIERGVAYASAGDVYFSVGRYPGYARLSGRDLNELRAGERVEPGEQKREPLDFALWKAAKPGEPAWDSPWGKGRPGWHIECSAMAARYLGASFDLHGGGLDLIFPHHENEIAQSEAASGKPFARYWLHCGFLDLEGAKMSKSLGNVVQLRDALSKVDPEALKLFFLSTHYRAPLNFAEKSLADAELRMEYFYATLQKVDERIAGHAFGEGPVVPGNDEPLRELEAQLDDDFNFAGGLAAVSALFTRMNELVDRPPSKDKALVGRSLAALREQVRALSRISGLFGDDPAAWLARRRDRAVRERGLDRERIEAMIAERNRARAEKRFGDADRLREELGALGVDIRDGPSGTTWRVIP